MTKRSESSAPVVKLGGSLFGEEAFGRLLDACAGAGAIVVAGGGPFADSVRDAQRILGFHDGAAHRMALYAMEQAAEFVAARRPDLTQCSSAAEFAAVARLGKAALWRRPRWRWRPTSLRAGT